jgi:hypothetical protein
MLLMEIEHGPRRNWNTFNLQHEDITRQATATMVEVPAVHW